MRIFLSRATGFGLNAALAGLLLAFSASIPAKADSVAATHPSSTQVVDLRTLVSQYQHLIDKRQYEQGLPVIKQAYEHAQQVYGAGNGSRQKIETDYMLALIEMGRFIEAHQLFNQIWESGRESRVSDLIWTNISRTGVGLLNPLELVLTIAMTASGISQINADAMPADELKFKLLNSIISNYLLSGRFTDAAPYVRMIYQEFAYPKASKDDKRYPYFSYWDAHARFYHVMLLDQTGMTDQAISLLEDTFPYLTSKNRLKPKFDSGHVNLPGESGLVQFVWPARHAYHAMLLVKAGRMDQVERIIGPASELPKYFKDIVQTYIHFRQGRNDQTVQMVESALANFDEIAPSSWRGNQTHFMRIHYANDCFACFAYLATDHPKKARQYCATALENRSTYIKGAIGDGGSVLTGIYISSQIAFTDLLQVVPFVPPSLELALEMSRHYAGEPSKYKEILETLNAYGEETRERSTVINNEREQEARLRVWVNKELARLYLKEGNIAGAFKMQEQTKARALLDTLNQRDALSANIVPAQDRRPLEQLELRLAKYEEQLGDLKLTDADKLKLQGERDEVVREHRLVRNRLYEKYPRFAEVANARIVGAEDAAQIVPADTAFISYSLHQDDIVAYAYADGQLTATSLGHYPALSKDIQALRERLADPNVSARNLAVSSSGSANPSPADRSETSQLISKLSQTLIDKLPASVLVKHQLIVAPDGMLSLLPFELLEHQSQRLIDQHDISYVQSLSMLAALHQRARSYAGLTHRQPLLAMGNPTYPESTGKQAVGAQESIGELAQRGRLDRAYDLAKVSWSPLPGTEREVNAIGKLFDKSSLYFKEAASEQTLQGLRDAGQLGNYQRLHFATHGYVDPAHPALNAIVLEQTKKTGTDGYLTMAELTGYEFKSDLITLSACETGVGKVVEGEGVLGLPYALYMAGNVNTLMTLWSVADDSTAQFMASFYGKLKAGQAIAKALNDTKREFLKQAELQHPFFWAPFVVYGG